MPASLTPVLMLGENMIAMMPLENPAVIAQGHVFKIANLDLWAIDSSSYDKLKTVVDMPPYSADSTRQYVVEQMMNSNDIALENKMSELGCLAMYEHLSKSGCSIDSMLIDMSDTVLYWSESTPQALLKRFGIEDPQMDEITARDAVLSHINDDEYLEYEAMHGVNGELHIVYRVTNPIWFDLNHWREL